MKFDRFLVPMLLLFPLPAIAQVVPLGSTVVTPSGGTQTITGGTSSVDGKNLFHRFDQFNVMTGQRALFDPGSGVRNILTRVNQSSMIDGVLQVNGGANLFLLSPSGLLFGQNARLSLMGNFFGTTATGLGFGGGVWTGENEPSALVGDPSSFVFALGQPSAIVNAGTLQNPGGTIALVGGQVANTGILNGGQVAIVAVPGGQRVQIGEAGGVLKFEFQPLPGQTVGEVLQNWTPTSLSNLIAKGNALGHGTRLETLPDGTVRVVGSSLTMGDGPRGVLLGGTIGGGSVGVMGDGVTIGDVSFNTSASTGSLLVDAARSLFLGGGSVNFGQGGTVTLRGGESIVSSVALLSRERDLVLQSPVIRTQLVDTSIAGNGVGGAIRLEGLNGERALSVGFGNLVTPGRDVSVRGDRVVGQFVITNATTGRPGVDAGKVAIESRYFAGIGGAITDGMAVTIAGDAAEVNGVVQSGLILTNGGDITVTGSKVNAGALWSSARDNNRTNGNAGNITVNAVTKLTADRVEANAKGIGRAGDVKIVNENGDVIVDSVQAYGGGSGGTVELGGDRVRVTGSVIDLAAGEPYQFRSVHAGERIAITHRGGRLNEDFVVGSSAVNGSNDRLQVGTGSLSQGAFAIRGGTYTVRPRLGLSVTSVNSGPAFPGGLSGFPVVVTPGLVSRFTLGGIGFPGAVDGEGDRVRLFIRPRPGAAVGGELLLEGNAVRGLMEVKLTDRLVYRPGSKIGETVLDRFEVFALDVEPTVEAIAGARVLPLVFTTPVIPVVDSIAAPEPARQAELPEDSGMSNVSLSEVAAMDKELSKDFEGMGVESGNGGIGASLDGTLAREIEGKTGVRPAIVYVRTLRRGDAKAVGKAEDTLELTILTSRGRFRRRVPIDAVALDAEVAKFRREVTNPIRTHTTSYLPMAQKLYGWLIGPMLNDLKSQGITNLVFIPEAGLRSLPYGALHDGKGFLIERFSVGIMPSLGLVQTGYRNLRNSSLLSVGVSLSTEGQSALPMVVPELSTISNLWGSSSSFLNDRATLASLQGSKKSQAFQILHLATHANFVAGKPKEAYIQLWNDRLRLDQLRSLEWNRPPIDLMVLSACKTAVGDRESELGFAGLALQSGVKTTIASLWSVNDTATMGLISQFYDRLLRSPVKAEALRSAQVAMLRGEVRIENGELVGFLSGLRVRLPEGSLGGDSSFRHPYYWSAFTVVGNPW